ncbi:glycosyltransferase [Paenibacillus sp. KQZ6P-2]|uniref:Glycosyltransferase n=1 Tax=Paenibacillus mangrovi TaxID=2931978 RepID=A0A9X1WU16_9BACL|nr:glycosyltransferase family 2 protein [Paenibacillus mangrovi]MCJ8013885.1 glycosyltransferase [Paenibacillus mangrovi]
MPKVTVLMPVYNTVKYIEDAVESILGQTYKDFEFLIIDDCSNDGTQEYLEELKDPRIKLIRHSRNKGLVYSLNEGVELAKGKYIARMDSDDISSPHRLKKQLEYLEKHPDVGVLGTYMTLFHNGQKIPKPKTHDEICCWQLFYCCMGHPTVVMRSDILKNNKILYDPKYLHAEDYEIWNRLGMITKIENLPKYLYSYRIHDSQVSTSQRRIQDQTADKVRIAQLNRMGITPTPEEYKIHMKFQSYNIKVHDYEDYSKALAWANKLLEHNERCRIYHQETLNRILSICFTRSENNGR